MPDKKAWEGESLGGYGSAQPKFSWVKLFLFVLSLACDAAVLWAIILLMTGRIDHISGVVLLVVAVACSLSGKSLWRRPSVSVVAVVIVFVIVALLVMLLCAFSEIEPFASAKDYLAAWIYDFGKWVMGKLRLAIEYLRGLLPAGR